MKLEIKAYKCHLPVFFTYSYGESLWDDSNLFQIIYGKSQKDAVKKICNKAPDWGYSFWEIKSCIRTKRFPEMDLYSFEKSQLLKGLSEKQINHLTHSLGVEIGKLCPDDFYRNYSVYNERHEDCEYLVSLGLMENWQKLDSQFYGVTEKGIKAVKTLLLSRLDSVSVLA
jgi:hypothetical protein